MERYRDWDGDSGIVGYEIGDGSITVQFRSGKNRYYLYTTRCVGAGVLSRMISLAQSGEGLNEYIVEEKIPYEDKW